MKKNMVSGFTLIELLIVVAIIAILAAIAVPNFLEAQVRSKVSRVKSDMRSIATAIESYAVDNNNKYPVGYGYPEGYARYRLKRITTPIAYITSIPDDPFKDKEPIAMYASDPADKPSYVYLIKRWKGMIIHPFNEYFALPDYSIAKTVLSDNIEWVLCSKGPKHDNTTTIVWIPYDATNGTISFGEILRGGP